MTATSQPQPPWMQGWKPAPPAEKPKRTAGNPGWKPGCASPNPKGRPAGIPDRRLLATQQMLDEMRNIVSVLVGKALEGDTNAASLVLARVMPSVKAQAEKVQFDYDSSAPASEQVAAVLDGVAQGKLAPDVARLIIDSIKSLAEVRTTEQLEARIIALEEAKAGGT
jgi:hypothetical protein